MWNSALLIELLDNVHNCVHTTMYTICFCIALTYTLATLVGMCLLSSLTQAVHSRFQPFLVKKKNPASKHLTLPLSATWAILFFLLYLLGENTGTWKPGHSDLSKASSPHPSGTWSISFTPTSWRCCHAVLISTLPHSVIWLLHFFILHYIFCTIVMFFICCIFLV